MIDIDPKLLCNIDIGNKCQRLHFISLEYMRAGGQCSPSPSYLPTDGVMWV